MLGHAPITGNEPPILLNPETIKHASRKIDLVVNAFVKKAVEKAKHEVVVERKQQKQQEPEEVKWQKNKHKN